MLHPRLAFTAMVLLVAVALPAHGQQDRLPNTLITATSLTQAQRELLQQFVRDAAEQMAQGSTQDVAEARELLGGEFRRSANLGNTAFFQRVYSAAVAEALVPLLQSQRLITRINALMLVPHARSNDLLPPTLALLRDPSPVARYAAAHAIEQMVQLDQDIEPANRFFQQAQLQTIQQAINSALSSEANAMVTRMMYLTLARLPLVEAQRSVLALLQTRLNQLREQDSMAPLNSQAEALRTMYLDLTMTRQPVIAGELSLTAAMYLAFAANQLADHGQSMDRALRDQRIGLIRICEAVLIYSSDPLANVPALQQRRARIEQLSSAIGGEQWREAALFAQELRQALQR